MFLILLASIYITLVCLVWGVLILHLTRGVLIQTLPHFSIICIIGFAGITAIAGILSIFLPLGGLQAQLIILLPAFIFLFRETSKNTLKKLIPETFRLKSPVLLLLFSCIVLIFVMGSWKIVHPDTLGYHAQTIQWIEKYKAVPGLVNLHARFGYQGLWFTTCALFSLHFLGTNAITFINTTILIWFFIFLINKINSSLLQKENYLNNIIWILLLTFSLWSYTLVRLTATSASPDFIGTILAWTIIYLLLEKNKNESENSLWLLISFLSISAITLKLSVLPLILFPIFAALKFLWGKKIKQFILLILIGSITLFPFVTRNIITSGYLVFPSTAFDIAHVDWQYNKDLTALEKDYIKAYARTEADRTKEQIDTAIKMKLTEWIPVWWKNRSAADKTILLFFILSFIISLVKIKKIFLSGTSEKVGLLIMLAGIIFWFINAPDPRFGFGFLIGYIVIIIHLLLPKIYIKKTGINFIMIASIVSVSAYSAYRFKNFFTKDQWLLPSGIEKSVYSTIDCNGIFINRPSANTEFGNITVPCTDDSCTHFIARGKKITDGFRAK